MSSQASEDLGEPDEILVAALDAGDIAAALSRILLARLLVPVTATATAAGEDEQSHGATEMAVPALINSDGSRALPAFSSLATLALWQPDARPVPMSGARVLAGAVAEGYDAVVVDVVGPQPLQLIGPVLTRLAEAGRRLLDGEAGSIAVFD